MHVQYIIRKMWSHTGNKNILKLQIKEYTHLTISYIYMHVKMLFYECT